MDKIKELIKEGEKLRSTFTKKIDKWFGVYTTDRESISEWNTKSTLELRKIFTKDDPLCKKFEYWIDRIGNMTLDDFNDLVGILKGIEKTSKESSCDGLYD